MAIRPFPVGLKESLKKKMLKKKVEKKTITSQDINKVLKGHLKRQKFLFMKWVSLHDYDQNYHETAE